MFSTVSKDVSVALNCEQNLSRMHVSTNTNQYTKSQIKYHSNLLINTTLMLVPYTTLMSVPYGPWWQHVLDYWQQQKVSGNVMFVTYEELQKVCVLNRPLYSSFMII